LSELDATRLLLPKLQADLSREIADPRKDEKLARAAVWFLFRSGAATKLLLPGLKGSQWTRDLTMVALGERGDAVAREVLFRLLMKARYSKAGSSKKKPSDPWMAWALGQLGGAANARLVRALETKRPQTRAQAARALGWAKHTKGTPALLRLLREDRVPEVRAAAAWALATLKASPDSVTAFQTEKHEAVRVELARWLARVPSPKMASGLKKRYRHATGAEIRYLDKAANRLLMRLPDKEAVDLFVQSARSTWDVDNRVLKRLNKSHLMRLKRATWSDSIASCDVPTRDLARVILHIEGYPAVAWLKKLVAQVMADTARRRDCIGYPAPVTLAIGDWAEKNVSHPKVPSILAQAWCKAVPIHWWRRDAAQAFAEYGQKFIPVLLQMLKLCTEDYPEAAARALVKLNAKQHATAILDAARRSNGASLLTTYAMFGSSVAREQLVRLLSGRRTDLAGEAARALGSLGDKRSLPAIRRLEARLRNSPCRKATNKAERSREEDCRERRKQAINGVIEALSLLGDTSDIARVRVHQKGNQNAVDQALLRLGDVSTLQRVPKMAQDSYPFGRRRLPVHTIEKLLHHPNASVRDAALSSALSREYPSSVASLIRLSRRADIRTREQILWALVDRRSSRSLSHFMRTLNHKEPRLVYAAAYGLAVLGNPKGLDAILRRLQRGPDAVRAKLVSVLCRVDPAGQSTLIPRLVAMLGRPAMRTRAQEILGCWKHPLGRPELLSALKSTDAKARRQALRLLEQQRPAVPEQLLIHLLGDSDASVRRLALRQLAQLGPAASAIVLRLLRRGDDTRRAEALRLSFGFINQELGSAILPLAHHGPTRIRILALSALGKLLDRPSSPLKVTSVFTRPHLDEQWPEVVLADGLLDERFLKYWFSLLEGRDSKIVKAARRNLSSWPLRPARQLLAKAAKQPTPQTAPYLGLWGVPHAQDALWKLFGKLTRSTDLRCMWHLTPGKAAMVILGLGHLGARRLLKGDKLHWIGGCPGFGMELDQRQEKQILEFLEEVSGRNPRP